MALATFTFQAAVNIATPPPLPPNPSSYVLPPYVPIATTVALPAGSSPTTVLVTNLGAEAAFVALTTAAATTTATGTAGSTTITVASSTSIATGQAAIAVGIAVGTYVVAVSGTTVTLSQPITAGLSGTTINFVTQVTPTTGVAVTAQSPVALAYGSNTFVSARCSSAVGAFLNVAVGT